MDAQNSAGGPAVRYAVDGPVATLTLDTPHNRNAISRALLAGLHDGLAAAADDAAVRAVVLTHTGGTFCAGADLSEAAESGTQADPAAQAAARTDAMVGLLRAIVTHPKPVVARIDGHVRAGGMGIVAACDLAVAGPRSSFALTEARLGLTAAVVSLTVLPRMTSRAASRYHLTGERFDAAEAERIGLIDITAEDPVAAVDGLVAELRRGSPQGLAESKALVNAEILAGFDARADTLAAQSARLFGSEEAREGMMAFLQKRDPWWAQ